MSCNSRVGARAESFTGFWGLALRIGIAFTIGVTGSAYSQIFSDDTPWAEAVVPPPPAWDEQRLLAVDVPSSPGLRFGVDPASIQISRQDGVVRYVMVASSPGGARNVMYEGLRCATGEFRTYARYSADGQWSPVTGSAWRSVFGNMPSRHPLRFAQSGACDGAAPASTVDAVVSKLKNTSRIPN